MGGCPSHNEPNSTLSGSLVCKIKASVLRPFQMTQQGNSLISTVNESLLFLNRPATLHQKPHFPLVSLAQLCKPARHCERKARATKNTQNSKWVIFLNLRASLLSCIQKNITVHLLVGCASVGQLCLPSTLAMQRWPSHWISFREHPEEVQD